MIVGLTYRPGVADMKNSLNFKIFKKIIKLKNKNNILNSFNYYS